MKWIIGSLLTLSQNVQAAPVGSLENGYLLTSGHWIGLAILFAFGIVLQRVVSWFVVRQTVRWQATRPNFQALEGNILRPLGTVAMGLLWLFGLKFLALPTNIGDILSLAAKLFMSLAAVWVAFRGVIIAEALLAIRAAKTNQKFDDLMVPMLGKSIRVLVMVIGFIFVASNLNIDVSSLLAGLGLGGLAFALAAKDLLGNFFGSLTVMLDRPFHIGDWVIIGDVEGSVEKVGFRSTRIRTFYNSMITLPNSILTTSKVDNMGARSYRRFKTTLGLTYDTSPEKIEAFCAGIRTLVMMHPYTRKDYYHVYFNGYSASSLDILIYVFWQTPDWGTELRERHRFLVDILRLAKQLNVEFAYPTQTLFLKQNGDEVIAKQPQGEFAVAMSDAAAQLLGKQEAEAIVDATVGRAVRPDPVDFPPA